MITMRSEIEGVDILNSTFSPLALVKCYGLGRVTSIARRSLSHLIDINQSTCLLVRMFYSIYYFHNIHNLHKYRGWR